MLRRTLSGFALALAAALALLAGALAWLAGTDAGSAWLLARVPGLAVEAPQGRLLGGPWSAARLEWTGSRRVVVERPAWRDLRWRLAPHAGAWLALEIEQPTAGRIEVGASHDPAPLQAPSSLRSPIALTLTALHVDRLDVEGVGALQAVRVERLDLGADGGRAHRVQGASARSARASLRGDAMLAADAPFELALRAQAASHEDAATPWQAGLRVEGPLAGPQLHAQLRSTRAAGAALDAQARLAPFAAWPLGTLTLEARDLDLAAFVEGAPSTRLSGRADISSSAADAPLQARASLRNAAPGRWDERRLPLATLEAEVSGSVRTPQRLSVRRLEARLAGDGGTLRGDGAWDGARAHLTLALNALRPASLDRRAAAMTLGGRLDVEADGLPAPDASQPAAARQRLTLRAALDGRLDARRDEAARVGLQATLQREGMAWRVEVAELDLRAGQARSTAQLQAQGTRGGAWRLASQGTLDRFDPTAWWSSLRGEGATQLEGRWRFDLQGPGALAPDLKGALALRGEALLELAPSRWSGVPLQGRLALDGRREGWGMQAELRAAANRLGLQGRLMPRPADDRWQLEIDAPEPAALTPLRHALGDPEAVAAWWPRAGRASARLQASGRWPELRLQGEINASAWQSPRLQAARLTLQGAAGPDREAPLALDIDGEALLLAGRLRLDRVTARLDGSLAAHRLRLDADSALRPPGWVDTLSGAAAGDGSRLTLAADGRWSAEAWRATLQSLQWGARGATGAAPWLAVQDVRAEVQLDAQGIPVAGQADAGRALLLGTPVQWRQARWQAAGAAQADSRFELDLELEALALAPWLQRAWPQAGLGGDLAVRGHARVSAGERFAADLVLERARGDLSYRDEDGTLQPFGLTDLRLALAAEDGTWHFTQALAGTQVGVLAGAQTLRVDARQRWPAADTPMQGVLEWRVADLGAWARFMPPGWHVAGTLHTSAALGGRFGAPEVEGEMVGSALAVRNLLQGVDVRDGELALSLRGAQARVERFSFKGGDGTLRVTGGATLGDAPSARLTLEAERFRLIGRVDRRLVASGRATLQLAPHALALDGRLVVDEGLVDVSRGDAPSLDEDVHVRGGRWSATADESARRPALAPRDLRVAVQVDLGRELKLRGRGLDTRLAGQLAVSAPGGRLALNGSVRAVDGQYAAYGQKLDIERGMLEFRGAVDSPRLDILAVRPHLDVQVGVQISGTALAPRVRLVSEPEMSEYDKLSWLVLGRASDGLARADTALLQRAALAILAGEERANDLASLGPLGLDDFSVRQRESGDVRETVVSLGKQLSRRWYVGYERSVNATAGNWQLIYRVAQRFTLRARAGEDSALDAIWTWRWN
ncbi:MAG TPA: translocation/assembly module TamB domain-containing protein [Burkholderiaceae bacterium]|nr:translocation/assembly module TamB domain-containing protein [Burkholderiaceae bacterium]